MIYSWIYKIDNYHKIEIGNSTKDFGYGFYCTRIKEQAIGLSKKYKTPIVTTYELEDISDLKVKVFEEYNEEWLDFIVHCRNGGKHDFDVVEAGDGEAALDLFYDDKDIALIILDVMMPKMNGWEVCREIRESSKVPIIMLTAKSDESDELMGFELGVDEYISKPFSPKILVARVEAILRRTNQLNMEGSLNVGGICLDKNAHTVTIDGKNIEMSFKEFELLTYFMENVGIALSREKILNHVWNYDYFGDARTIDTHVKKLRSKLGDKGEYIKTIWGMGYKFEV